jgi:hypothetical protein
MKHLAILVFISWSFCVQAEVDIETLKIRTCLETLDMSFSSGLMGMTGRIFFNPNPALPDQVITTDKSVLAEGATSAVITGNGKVIQIRQNGSCELVDKGLKSAHEFIANQIAKPDRLRVLKLTMQNKDLTFIQRNCDKLPHKEPYDTIRSALILAGLLNSESTGSEAAPGTKAFR